MVLKPVDTAIIMVVGPCIDDIDFKTLEESIAYNAAGMDISLIIEKTDGTSTTTVITLTTGATSDWTHKDGGYYEVEITAAQNAEEGIAYLRGVCTGVLPFESPRYEIVKANIYDSLIKSTDNLCVDIKQISGSTTAADTLEDFVNNGYNATLNRCYVDVKAINGDTAPVANINLDYNGTGYNKLNSTIGTTTINTDMVSGFSTHSAADVWSVVTRALTDKSDFGLSTTSINLIWDDLISGMTEVGSIGKLIADNLNAAITSRSIPNEYDTQMGYIPSDLGSVPIASELNSAHGSGSWATATGFSTHNAANVWSVATRILTASTNFNDLSTSDINTEVANALAAIKLDHLLNIAVDTNWATTVHLDSVIGQLADVGTSATFDRITDSQEAIRNKQTDIETDTAEIGTAGAGLIDLGGMSTGMKAEVENEAGDALTSYGANTTTPPTVTEIRTEMDSNSTKMAPSQTLADYKATGFSTHSATNVWSVATRSLTDKTGFSLSTAGIKSIWDQLTSALTTVGSAGKLLVDNINATISSRSPVNEYDTEMGRLDVAVSSRNAIAPNTVIPDVAGTAGTLHGITDGKIDVMDAIVDAIKAKTDNLPSGITKNKALPKFDFLMVLASDHITAATGKTITGEIMKDGNTFAAITNTITEVSNGMYTIADGFTQDEMNAHVITLQFSEGTCDTRTLTIVTN